MTTKAQLFTELAHVANRWAFMKTQGYSASPNFLGLIQAQQVLNNGYDPGRTALLAAEMQSWSDTAGLLKAQAEGILKDLGMLYGVPKKADLLVRWRRIFDGMTTATETVKNRAFTMTTASPQVFSGSGIRGSLYRCKKDRSNQIRESGNGQDVYAICTGDKNNTASSGNEEISLSGNIDGVPVNGFLQPGTISDESTSINMKLCEDGILLNPSFEDGTGDESSTTTSASFPNWSAFSGSFSTNIKRYAAAAAANTAAAPYRNAIGATTGRCGGFTGGTCELGQYLSATGKKLNPNLPVLCMARIFPSTATAFQGTAQIRLGTKTKTLAHGAMAAGWQDIAIPFDDDDAWYPNFMEDDIRFSLGLSAWTQGTLYFDTFTVVQGELYDGGFYVATAGQNDVMLNDALTYTVSVADTGEIQTMLSDMFGIYLPHTSGSPTYADI